MIVIKMIFREIDTTLIENSFLSKTVSTTVRKKQLPLKEKNNGECQINKYRLFFICTIHSFISIDNWILYSDTNIKNCVAFILKELNIQWIK